MKGRFILPAIFLFSLLLLGGCKGGGSGFSFSNNSAFSLKDDISSTDASSNLLQTQNINPAQTSAYHSPEPTTLIMWGTGLLLFIAKLKKRRS